MSTLQVLPRHLPAEMSQEPVIWPQTLWVRALMLLLMPETIGVCTSMGWPRRRSRVDFISSSVTSELILEGQAEKCNVSNTSRLHIASTILEILL